MSFAITAVAVSAVGIGVSMYGSSQQASAQKKAGTQAAKNGGIQQAQSEFEAGRLIEQSQEEARKVRQEAIYARGTQAATAASAGVLVGDGSVQSMTDEVTRLAEQDAVQILWSGANGYMSKTEEGRLAAENGRFQSQQANAAAKATLISGYAGAISSMGSTLGKASELRGKQ
jgi:hypothetical protein